MRVWCNYVVFVACKKKRRPKITLTLKEAVVYQSRHSFSKFLLTVFFIIINISFSHIRTGIISVTRKKTTVGIRTLLKKLKLMEFLYKMCFND